MSDCPDCAKLRGMLARLNVLYADALAVADRLDRENARLLTRLLAVDASERAL